MGAQNEVIPYRTVIERLRQVEAVNDLLRYTVDGWCAWTLLRFDVALALANVTVPPQSHNRLSLRDRLMFTLRDLPGLLKVRRAKYVIKTYSSALVEQEGPQYKDIYFDDLLLNIDNYFKIEGIGNRAFLPRSQAALVKRDISSASIEIAAAALKRVTKIHANIISTADELSACIRTELGLESFTPRHISQTLWHFHWSKKIYEWLLSRIKPDLLLVADAGEFNLVAAAKELKIAVVEFQHGFINPDSHFMRSWSDYAVRYKAKMPIADQIFVYGDYWKDAMERNSFWRGSIYAVGSLRMDAYRRFSRLNPKDEENCVILWTSHGIDVELLVRFIADFLKLVPSDMKMHVYVKLHPSYESSKELYERILPADSRVQVLSGDEMPSTFELLTRSHLHVSVSSTCHYEALALGVPTVILQLPTSEAVEHLYQSGQAMLARSPQELADLVVRWKTYVVPVELSDYYFKPHALENIKHELGLIK